MIAPVDMEALLMREQAGEIGDRARRREGMSVAQDEPYLTAGVGY